MIRGQTGWLRPVLHGHYLGGIQQQRSREGVHWRIAPALQEEAPLPACRVTIDEMRMTMMECEV